MAGTLGERRKRLATIAEGRLASPNNTKADETRANKLSLPGAGTMQAIDTARAQVAVLMAVIAGDQAAIDAAKLNLEFTTVKAPIAGRTGLRQIKP